MPAKGEGDRRGAEGMRRGKASISEGRLKNTEGKQSHEIFTGGTDVFQIKELRGRLQELDSQK